MSIGQKKNKRFYGVQAAAAAAVTLAITFPQISLSQTSNDADSNAYHPSERLSGEVSADRNVKTSSGEKSTTSVGARNGATGAGVVTGATGAKNNIGVGSSTTNETTKNAGGKSMPDSASAVKAKAKPTPDSYLDAQLAREKSKHHQYYEGLAKNVSETGHYQAAHLRAQASTKPAPRYIPNDNVYIPPSLRVPGYTPSNSGLPPKSPVYVSQEEEYAKMKLQMAEEKAAQLRKVSAEKEALLDQTMDNMKSQMKDSRVPGAAVAKPEGSNLFVRYYGPSNSSKPYEVHPAAARIVPHQ